VAASMAAHTLCYYSSKDSRVGTGLVPVRYSAKEISVGIAYWLSEGVEDSLWFSFGNNINNNLLLMRIRRIRAGEAWLFRYLIIKSSCYSIIMRVA
jgi:hypothetical protein